MDLTGLVAVSQAYWNLIMLQDGSAVGVQDRLRSIDYKYTLVRDSVEMHALQWLAQKTAKVADVQTSRDPCRHSASLAPFRFD